MLERGLVLAAQERIGRAYIEAHGGIVYRVYVDEGIRGRTDKRPALQDMLNDVRLGRNKGVVVHKLDRLARNLRLTLDIIEELHNRGCAFATISENLDFTSAIGWAVFQVQGVFAEMYSRNLATETAKGLREKAEQGLWVGPVPFGYVRDGATLRWSPDAPIVRRIYELYGSGLHSFSDIADLLNGEGLRAYDWQSGRHNLFGRETTRTILRNPAYRGIVRCADKEYPGQHPPIVSPELWNRVQTIREERSSKGGQYSVSMPKIGGLLSEIAFCSECGERMWLHHSGNKNSRGAYYV